ncbi:MAG: exosortase [Gemmatimonadota bacterium]
MVAPVANAPATLSFPDFAKRAGPFARIAGPVLLTALAFVVLFQDPARSLARDWWNDPDAGHGLLLFPVSLWLAWRAGIVADARPAPGWGTALIIASILLRALGGLAAEFFTQRFSIWLTVVGVVVFCFGWRQARVWWLPITLMLLSIPLPALVTNKLAIPLQFKASQLGTELINWRKIPVMTRGNVIQIPEGRLFVAEACSGLRSLTALIALGVMIGGMYLATLPARLLLVLLAVPVAIALNGVRIFLTAFLMHFVDPALGRGFMHESEGWAMFMIAFVLLGMIAFCVRLVERRISSRKVGFDA